MKKLGLLLMLLLAMTMQSHHVFAQSVTITLMPGWNWISVPLMDTLDFQTAMGTVTPVDGDIIKSHWGSAAYSNGQWRGTISQFYPGYGYHYKSNRTMPVFLTFTAQQPNPQVIVTTAEPTDITANSATCGGNVASSDGNVFVILKCICWSINPNPTFNDNYLETGDGLGSFNVSMTELAYGTTYYVRAFAVTASGTFFGEEVNFTTLDQTWPNGVSPNTFSVSATLHVYFSQGNLQYKASTNTWKFAENQWDYVGTHIPDYGGYAGGTINGSDNCNISSTYGGWIDLFGWGTSGYNHGANCYQPWSTSENQIDYYAYGDFQYNLCDQTGQADWGYNPISNGGNTDNQWRTLTQQEWQYVFNIRSTPSGIRFAKAKVNAVNGVILLPDNWNNSIYSLNNTNNSSAVYSSNILSALQWTVLEDAGAVFLPAAGYRTEYLSNTVIYHAGFSGYYWSASHYSYQGAYNILFNDSELFVTSYHHCVGFSVRLVHDAE